MRCDADVTFELLVDPLIELRKERIPLPLLSLIREYLDRAMRRSAQTGSILFRSRAASVHASGMTEPSSASGEFALCVVIDEHLVEMGGHSESESEPPRGLRLRFEGETLPETPEDTYTGLDWEPNGNRLATSTRRGRIEILDADRRAVVSHIDLQPSKYYPAGPVRWSPDGRHLAVDSGESLSIWSLTSHQVVKHSKGSSMHGLDWTEGLIAGSAAGKIRAATARALALEYPPRARRHPHRRDIRGARDHAPCPLSRRRRTPARFL
jgi:hypothetical protein